MASSLPFERVRVWRPGRPVDLRRTLGALARGGGDPTVRREGSTSIWRAVRTPVGPGTVHIAAAGSRLEQFDLRAWGPGADWLLEQAPASLGELDHLGPFAADAGFAAPHPCVADAFRRFGSWRIGRTEALLDALITAVLEQRVTGGEARASWRTLVRRFGTPAPGPAPAGLLLSPGAEQWRAIPSWEWHRAGVEQKRASAVLAICRVAGRLEEAASVVLGEGLRPAPADDAVPDDLLTRRLRAVPGVGTWTIAEARQRALGDPDAVSAGDFHVAKDVGWALTGRPVDDAGMLQLLTPYAGQRYRAVRLLELAGARRPRFAPRYSPLDFTSR